MEKEQAIIGTLSEKRRKILHTGAHHVGQYFKTDIQCQRLGLGSAAMKNRNAPLSMIRIVTATFALAAVLVLGACSNVLQNGVSPPVPNKESFHVSVFWNGGDAAASKSTAFDDGSVAAVTVLVYNALDSAASILYVGRITQTLTGTGVTSPLIGTLALFINPYGMTSDGTNLYVADYGNNSIRKIQ